MTQFYSKNFFKRNLDAIKAIPCFVFLVLFLFGCGAGAGAGGGGSAGATGGVVETPPLIESLVPLTPSVASIKIIAESNSIPYGMNAQLQAVAYLDNGESKVITANAGAQWASDNASALAVSESGVITALQKSPSPVNISVKYHDKVSEPVGISVGNAITMKAIFLATTNIKSGAPVVALSDLRMPVANSANLYPYVEYIDGRVSLIPLESVTWNLGNENDFNLRKTQDLYMNLGATDVAKATTLSISYANLTSTLNIVAQTTTLNDIKIAYSSDNPIVLSLSKFSWNNVPRLAVTGYYDNGIVLNIGDNFYGTTLSFSIDNFAMVDVDARFGYLVPRKLGSTIIIVKYTYGDITKEISVPVVITE